LCSRVNFRRFFRSMDVLHHIGGVHETGTSSAMMRGHHGRSKRPGRRQLESGTGKYRPICTSKRST
jgi:hypothetical protein